MKLTYCRLLPLNAGTESTMPMLNKRKRRDDHHPPQTSTPAAPETVDLTDDGLLTFPSTPIKRVRVVTSPQDSAVKIKRAPSATPSKATPVAISGGNEPPVPSQPVQSRTSDQPTAPTPTPAKNASTQAPATTTAIPDLYQIPELADRYIPQTSTDQRCEFVNPQRFCLKSRD